ncbi:hypothetical protein ACLKMH_15255 [Psychromonas sp. KJ10-10]|uniref:hypothetical protein n=1 Tax=Psychromonas sp. KJ10-10 TaxID=3391823 RepID=UPI0039B367DA
MQKRLSELCHKGELFKPYDIGSKKLKTLVDDINYAYDKTVQALEDSISQGNT